MAGNAGHKALFFFALFFLPFFGSATDIALTIEPRDANAVSAIYKDELVPYQIKIINFGAEKATGLYIELNAEKELAIIDNAAEKQVRSFLIEQIKPAEIAVIDVLLKAKADSSEKAIVSANYGFETFTNATVAFLKIVPSKIDVSVKAKNPYFAPVEENKLLLSIKNNSGKTISSVSAELVLPADFESDTNELVFDSIAPGQKIENAEFGFRAKELAQGKRRLAVLVSFTDESGKHTLDKAIDVEVKSQTTTIFIILLIVVAIAAIALVFGKKGEPVAPSKKAVAAVLQKTPKPEQKPALAAKKEQPAQKSEPAP